MLSVLCTPDFLSRKKVKVSKLRGVGEHALPGGPASNGALAGPAAHGELAGGAHSPPILRPQPTCRHGSLCLTPHTGTAQSSRTWWGGNSRGRPSLGSGKGPASPATPLPGHDASRAPAEKQGATNKEHRAGHREAQNCPHVKWPFAEVQVTGDHGLAKGLSEQSNWAGWEGDTLSTSPF